MRRCRSALLLLAILVIPTWEELHAQALFLRDAKITVTPNTVLSVDGEVDNEGTIENQGHLKVAGPWVNSGSYISGDGEITFNSRSATLPQIIHHNGQTFNTLTLDGGTKKVLLSDIIVAREIRFRHGIVEEAGDAQLVFNPGTLITDPSDSSHVHGMVFQRGGGYKLFPLGNGSKYLPVELTDVKDPSAMIGIQSLEFGNASLLVPSTLKAISPDQYWHIDITSGTPDSPIILPLPDVSWADDPEKIVVVQSPSMASGFSSIGRSMEQGNRGPGRIQSEFNVSLPFVALATAAGEEEIIVHNAVSNNGDDLNDYMIIENIENYWPNSLVVFNRWGDKVFEINNYDNQVNVFRGRKNVNGDAELVSGTYFYVLHLPNRESLRGFISVKN